LRGDCWNKEYGHLARADRFILAALSSIP
jgi:hypothetical protein